MDSFDNLLKEGSRSFYLSLRVLPPCLRPAMGTGYLVCRLADTLTDTDILPYEEKITALKAFISMFEGFPELGAGPNNFKKTLSNLKFNDSGRDGRFFSQYPVALKAFASLSPTERTLVSRVLGAVGEGMKMDLEKFPAGDRTVRCLTTEMDRENYLTWIGGEPGRFWSSLLLHHYPAFAPERTDQWIALGMEFGRGLQMINILRDMREDYGRGRCYLSEEFLQGKNLTLKDLGANPTEKAVFAYNSLIEETLIRLQNGFFYLRKIPRKEFRLRAPVWWPLMIGLKTLGRLKRNPSIQSDKKPKITRNEVYKTLAYSSLTLWSERVMRWEFEDLASEATESFENGYALPEKSPL